LVVHGTLATRFHGVISSPAATGFDDNANSITTIGISLEIVPLPFQKVNHHCLGIVTGASGLTITFASNFLDWYMHNNIQSCIGECGANSTGYESGPIRKSQQRLIHYLVR